MQREGLARTNPTIAECPEGFVSQLVPFAGKGPQIKTLAGDIVGHLCRDRNQIVGSQIRFEVNKSLDGS